MLCSSHKAEREGTQSASDVWSAAACGDINTFQLIDRQTQRDKEREGRGRERERERRGEG